MRELFVLFFLFVWCVNCIQYEILPYNPVADPKAVVVNGNARFTVLTSNLIRLEYSDTRKFEDRATVAVVNRMLPVPSFTQSSVGLNLVITTSSLVLNYRQGAPFTGSTLNITARDGSFSWVYGQSNPGNLLGTIKSLDELNVISLNCTENSNVKIHDEVLHCEWGLVSRNGWSVVNDTTNWGLTSTSWWDSPNTDTLDLYFFGHGTDYKKAISDYIQIGGKMAMVPRYASGIWWSRWFNLNNIDVMSVIEAYLDRHLPLDVYILDMDWHTKYGWGTYTFDTNLFPIPENTLDWLKTLGLPVGANLHDDNGVHSYEKMYKDMCQAMGLNPNSGNPIPFNCVNFTYMLSLEDIVLKDVEKMGMSFWWIDWQQGGTQGGCQGEKQNPTYMLNHMRSTDHVRRGENTRGLVLARWGGLGNHRYQVGFSGDVAQLNWENLAFQPYFSFTASNVAYGFWSHDIVGPAVDHELHTRWIQWGAYSGIFRTHDRGMAVGSCNDQPNGCPRVEVWNVPDKYFEINRAALIDREELIPYIYTAVRQAFDTGISLLRPMYYEFPQSDVAYAGNSAGKFGQYFFGDDMFVSPITTPLSSNTTMAASTIWIPPGMWFEKVTGALHSGSDTTFLSKYFDLSEIPVFIRAGAIIPKIRVPIGDTIALAQRQYTTLVLSVYPGSLSGSTKLYEDDGITTDYLSGKYTWTTISYTRTNTNMLLTVSPPQGSFPEFPSSRSYIFEIVNSLPVIDATINGNKITYSRKGGPFTWRYDGTQVTTIIESGPLSTQSKVELVVTTNAIDDHLMVGMKGVFTKSILAKRNLDAVWGTPGSGSVQSSYLADLAATGFTLSYLAGTDMNTFMDTLKGVPQLYANALSEINNLRPSSPLALVQLWNPDRQDNCLCGSPDCISTNGDYQHLRIEGYQPKPGTPGTVNLNDFWNPSFSDNYATTQTLTPQGYSPAVFGDGIVFKNQQPGTVPLQLFWSEQRKDMLTVASAEGLSYAKKYGYTEMNSTLGYVLTQEPSFDLGLTFVRWSYSYNLLANSIN